MHGLQKLELDVLGEHIEILLPELTGKEAQRAGYVRDFQLRDVVKTLYKTLDIASKNKKTVKEDVVDLFLKRLEAIVQERTDAGDWLRCRAENLAMKLVKETHAKRASEEKRDPEPPTKDPKVDTQSGEGA